MAMTTCDSDSVTIEHVFITDIEIKEKFNISQPTLWRLEKYRGFPKAIVKGKRSFHAVRDWAKENGMVVTIVNG